MRSFWQEKFIKRNIQIKLKLLMYSTRAKFKLYRESWLKIRLQWRSRPLKQTKWVKGIKETKIKFNCSVKDWTLSLSISTPAAGLRYNDRLKPKESSRCFQHSFSHQLSHPTSPQSFPIRFHTWKGFSHLFWHRLSSSTDQSSSR